MVAHPPRLAMPAPPPFLCCDRPCWARCAGWRSSWTCSRGWWRGWIWSPGRLSSWWTTRAGGLRRAARLRRLGCSGDALHGTHGRRSVPYDVEVTESAISTGASNAMFGVGAGASMVGIALTPPAIHPTLHAQKSAFHEHTHACLHALCARALYFYWSSCGAHIHESPDMGLIPSSILNCVRRASWHMRWQLEQSST